jgi:peptide deformylase
MESQQLVELKGLKRLFLKKGSCSRTLGFIVNREFGNLSDTHERALDPLAGGILQNGYQCGMLWGASMAVGAETFHRFKDKNKAIAVSIKATQHLMKSLENNAGSVDCADISETNWKSTGSVIKHFVTGKVFHCFKVLEQWAPDAVQAAYEGLEQDAEQLPKKCLSCASEMAKKMGATDEEQIMVAGWAGGAGLSGNACGALAAAIWMNTLAKCKEQPGKSFFNNPEAKELVEKLYKETDYEMECFSITNEKFESLDKHTEFIENGGCKDLIEALSKE